MTFWSKLQNLFGRTSEPTSEEAEAVVRQLIELGFLKFVPESEWNSIQAQLVESVRNEYLDSEWDNECVSADKRSYAADGEDLAEGCVGECVSQMKDVLIQEGITLNSVEDDFRDEQYRVIINGEPHLINDDPLDPERDSWTQATRKLLEVVNLLLEDAGSSERLYAIYGGGNDGRVMLLTKEMHELLRANAGIFDERWVPVSAAEIKLSR